MLLTETEKDKINILSQWKIGGKLQVGSITCYVLHAEKQKMGKAAAYFSSI